MASTKSAELKKAGRLLELARSGGLRPFKRAAKNLVKDKGLAEAIAFACDKYGNGPLHFAAAGGNIALCRYLIDDMKFDPNSSPHTGKTPIIHAASGGHVDTIEYLINRGANLDTIASDGLTAVHTAILEGHPKALRVLVSRGGPVDAENLTGTPLLLAAYFDDVPCMKILLDHKADPNKVWEFISPLVISANNNSRTCVEVLIKAGADLNKIPLLERAIDSEEMTLFLLENGANPNLPNESGRLPVEIAAAKGQKKILKILFPLTSPITIVPEWSIKGLFSYVESEGFRKEEQALSKQRLESLKNEIKHALRRKEYFGASILSDIALKEDPTDSIARVIRLFSWRRLASVLDATDSSRVKLPAVRGNSLVSENQNEETELFEILDRWSLGSSDEEIRRAIERPVTW